MAKKLWALGSIADWVFELVKMRDSKGGGSLRLGDVTIQFKFAFDVGRNVHPLEAAQRLLETDIAQSAVWRGEIVHAERFRELKRLRQTYEQNLEANRRLQEIGFGSFVRYLVLRPRLVMLLLQALRRGTATKEGPETAASGDRDGGIESADAVFDDIDHAVARTSMIQQLLDLVDNDLFNPDFLSDGPWCRIELEPAFGVRNGQPFNMDVWLLIHLSGSAVMTFSVRHESVLSPAELSEVSLAAKFKFEETELPMWVVDAVARVNRSPVVGPDSSRVSGGITWSTWKHDEPVSIVDLFELYQDGILAALHSRAPAEPKTRGVPFASQWSSFPVITVRDTDPRVFDLTDEDAQLQVGGVVARLGNAKGFRREMLIREAAGDISITDASRLWINGGQAISMLRPPKLREMSEEYGEANPIREPDWIWLEQQTAVPIDFLLLRCHTAHAMAAYAQRLPHRVDDLHGLQARMLAAKFSLLRPDVFSYGTLRSIEEVFDRERGTAKSWRLADEAVAAIGSVLETEERAASHNREVGLQFVLGIIAVVLGIPAAHRVVEILSRVDDQGENAWWGLGRFIDIATSAATESPGPMVVVLVLAQICLVSFAMRLGSRRLRQRIPLATRARGRPPHRMPFRYFEFNKGFRWVLGGNRNETPREHQR